MRAVASTGVEENAPDPLFSPPRRVAITHGKLVLVQSGRMGLSGRDSVLPSSHREEPSRIP